MIFWLIGILTVCLIAGLARLSESNAHDRKRSRRHVRVRNLFLDMSDPTCHSRSNPSLLLEREPSAEGCAKF